MCVYVYIYVYVYNTCITESLCCTAEINTNVNQLYFNFLKSSLKKKPTEIMRWAFSTTGKSKHTVNSFVVSAHLIFLQIIPGPIPFSPSSLSSNLPFSTRPPCPHCWPPQNAPAPSTFPPPLISEPSFLAFHFYIIHLSNSNIRCHLLTYSIFYLCFENINSMRACLQVHWLRPCATKAGGPGSIPGWRTRSHPPQQRVCMPQLRSGATK